jgi:hypothetical protein
MFVFDSFSTAPLVVPASHQRLDQAQLVATAATVGGPPLKRLGAQIEPQRAWPDDRRLAVSSVDRRLSTGYGHYSRSESDRLRSRNRRTYTDDASAS